MPPKKTRQASATSTYQGRQYNLSGPTPAELELISGKKSGMIRSPEFARKLGVHPRTIARAFDAGELPGAKRHGERILIVPLRLLRLAETYGLHQVRRMARLGML